MITPSTAWLEAVARDNARIVFYVEIYNGNTWAFTSGDMDSGSDLAGTDVALQKLKPLGVDLDPLTRKFKSSMIELVVDDAWIRPIWTANRLKGQRVNIYVGAAELDQADFEVYAINAQIEELIPNPGKKSATIQVLGQLAIINRAHIPTSYWLNKHPLEVLYNGDGTGVLEIAGGHTFNANSFDETQAVYNDIDYLIVSRAHTRVAGVYAGEFSDWNGVVEASKATGGQLSQEIVRLLNGQLIENGSGELEFKLFDTGASADDDWTVDDILPGSLKQETTDLNAINQLIVNFGQDYMSRDLTRSYTANDTDSQSDLKFPGESERVISHEWDSPWIGTRLWLGGDISAAATSLTLKGLTNHALSGNRSGMAISGSKPVYLLLDSSRIHGTNNTEIVKVAAMTRSTDDQCFVNVFTGGTTWESAGPFVHTVTLSSITRAQRGTTASEHFFGSLVYDITPLVLVQDELLSRFSYGCPILTVETPINKFALELGDTISITTDEYLSFGNDGLTSSDLWEIVSKQADFFARPPKIKWKLASKTVTTPTFTGISDVIIAATEQEVSASSSDQAGQFFVADGLDTSQSTGAITAFADAGGGQVTVTSAAHGLTENETITIAGTTNYNGNFTATNVTTNTFEITDGWVADDATGTWSSRLGVVVASGLAATQAEIRGTMGENKVVLEASKDTYFYQTVVGTAFGGIVAKQTANGAGDPGTGDDEIFIGKVVTNATDITSTDIETGVNKEPFPGVKVVAESLGSRQTIPENVGRNHNFDINVWSRGSSEPPDGWNII
jgi:hypothetical protein